ncbi:MAG: tRNA lysidine(34) synthetase TilS [Gammaproteobacteria bacterium]|nr:tRNA lysidine(34) synthetase TilS [Gammaproteobacteria bacterium]
MNKTLLSDEWRQTLLQFKRLFVGFSGGLDSSALLHVLSLEPLLFERLHAIHVHHGLSVNADLWQRHCEEMCQQRVIPLQVRSVQCQQTSNQEAIARSARYQVFDELLGEGDALVLAHHQDDQAETLLLQLSRGAGIDGLCAMWPERRRQAYTVLRPFLAQEKHRLLAYAQYHQLQWVEDESNQQTDYRRNALRHDILPSLATLWPQVRAQFAQVAAHSQQASANLFDLACLDYPALREGSSILPLTNVRELKPERFANVLWYWLKQQQVTPLNQHMVQRVMSELVAAKNAAGKRVRFAHLEVWCYQHALHVVPLQCEKSPCMPLIWHDFPHALVLPDARGKLVVSELLHYSRRLGLGPTKDRLLGQGPTYSFKSSSEISKGAQTMTIEVRFRKGGETFYWHGQTKSLKKCFQDWHIPPWRRHEVPLIYANGELVQVVGFAVGDRFKALGFDESPIVWEQQNA